MFRLEDSIREGRIQELGPAAIRIGYELDREVVRLTELADLYDERAAHIASLVRADRRRVHWTSATQAEQAEYARTLASRCRHMVEHLNYKRAAA